MVYHERNASVCGKFFVKIFTLRLRNRKCVDDAPLALAGGGQQQDNRSCKPAQLPQASLTHPQSALLL